MRWAGWKGPGGPGVQRALGSWEPALGHLGTPVARLPSSLMTAAFCQATPFLVSGFPGAANSPQHRQPSSGLSGAGRWELFPPWVKGVLCGAAGPLELGGNRMQHGDSGCVFCSLVGSRVCGSPLDRSGRMRGRPREPLAPWQ